MKRFTKTLLIGLLLCIPAACSDDDYTEPTPEPEPEPEQAYPTFAYSQIEMSEYITTDAQPVTSTQTYLYQDGLLRTRIGKQEITSGGEVLWETADTTTVAYNGDKVTVTEETGTTLTYKLNLQGYATECIRQERAGNIRSYTFTYNIDSEGRHQLASITEYIDGTPFSLLTIDYTDEYTMHIVQNVDGFEQGFTASLDPNDPIENLSDIPSLFFTDIYPLSLHSAALYAKLIGEHTAYLMYQITPDSDGTTEETTTYSYAFNDEGIVTSCQEALRHKESDGSMNSYRRTVYYDIQRVG